MASKWSALLLATLLALLLAAGSQAASPETLITRQVVATISYAFDCHMLACSAGLMC
jgi:hypothetical protein